MAASSTAVQYMWVDGVEAFERYEPGGYHPVIIDDLMNKRYRIVDKLGHGGYSTIWLAHDTRLSRYVALKVAISESSSPSREPDILRKLGSPKSSLNHPGRRFIPGLWDEFRVQGPNGVHTCFVTAPAQGDLKKASFSRLFPVNVARALAAALVNAVSYVHSQGFVHGDIRVRNVLVKLPSSFDDLSIEQFKLKHGDPETEPVRRVDSKPLTNNVPPVAVSSLYLGKSAEEFTLVDAAGLLLTDFGEAFEPAKEKRVGRDSHIPVASSPPEAWFEPSSPLSYPSDVWSLATAIWDILGMKFLFSESEPPDEVAAEHLDVLGTQGFPKSWWEIWVSKKNIQIDEDTTPRQPPANLRSNWPPLDIAFEEYIQKYRRMRKDAVGMFGDEETEAILELMRNMLKFRPEERLTVDQVLESKWMVKWALPDLQQAVNEARKR